jgi:ADP-ribose pyrophosphatase YjhB (NUDIX family)
VREETGLLVEPTAVAGVVERPAPGGGTYVIEDFVATPAPDTDPAAVTAGDDAADVGWFGVEELAELPVVPGLLEALADWGLLPG